MCGAQRASGDRTPQIRQGLGNLLIFSPILSLELDRRCVEDSDHCLSAIGADWFVFFTLDASSNANGHRAFRAVVFIRWH